MYMGIKKKTSPQKEFSTTRKDFSPKEYNQADNYKLKKKRITNTIRAG